MEKLLLALITLSRYVLGAFSITYLYRFRNRMCGGESLPEQIIIGQIRSGILIIACLSLPNKSHVIIIIMCTVRTPLTTKLIRLDRCKVVKILELRVLFSLGSKYFKCFQLFLSTLFFFDPTLFEYLNLIFS